MEKGDKMYRSMNREEAEQNRSDLMDMIGQNLYEVSYEVLFREGFPDDPAENFDVYIREAQKRSKASIRMRIWVLEMVYNIEMSLRGVNV